MLWCTSMLTVIVCLKKSPEFVRFCAPFCWDEILYADSWRWMETFHLGCRKTDKTKQLSRNSCFRNNYSETTVPRQLFRNNCSKIIVPNCSGFKTVIPEQEQLFRVQEIVPIVLAEQFWNNCSDSEQLFQLTIVFRQPSFSWHFPCTPYTLS